MRRRFPAIAGLVLIVAACTGGAGPTLPPGSPVPPSPAASSAPSTGAATPSDTASPSETVGPSASVFVSVPPTASASPSVLHSPTASTALDAWTGDPPLDSERIVLGHVPAGVFGTCESTEQRWGGEIDSVYCFGERFDATYAAFLALDVLQAAFALDVAAADPTPRPGSCTSPPFRGSWSMGAAGGRVLCTQYDDFGTIHRVIQWTEERSRVMGYLTTTDADWPELVAFWEAQARRTS